MKASEGIKKLIKNFESCVLTAYKCAAGVLTIGYGHTKNVKPGQKITQVQADRLFDEDLTVFENFINGLGLNLNQHQFDALVSICYNIGTGNFKNSTLLKRVKVNPNDKYIRDAFYMWNKAKGKVLPGLVKRRLAEADWYFKE